jgi:hypothetical protein
MHNTLRTDLKEFIIALALFLGVAFGLLVFANYAHADCLPGEYECASTVKPY